ncbi:MULTISPECIES: uroporphyrinogen-III synthase [Pseudonocardia]|uniref:Bifunctional uroporphyrinogen-III synthetase/response regulator domain protein n=2 Tax=Pseudonocardia TaxID=1847 RepID=A0A1Y2N4T1_PSEAH|nr:MULTISPECIES: uroporphyrinogen-III synthase [Pseudonocardia]OSY42494.1 bifunctional uroporphyrinogen-III synthetase/response regulator domain protein [Pseudonocardia autotrophica]TDN76013.1 uroporphyrinogen-III synthase [Pseudonocardia autotrophica]BBF99989.1 uroporphyrinogen-III synthase [Pseudonocardia autotrophica]GEC25049.1 uroporphyrinogen-III synthase [Pseudonocardia saturnea]
MTRSAARDAAPAPDTAPVPPLAGFTVGITAARRAEELATMLERRGATVQHGPALRIVALADDDRLENRTRELVAAPPDITVATTGIGYRGWIEAADGWGIGEDLLAALGRSEMLARGPKARGAIRASGLVDAWSPESESTAEVLEHLLERGVEGCRIAVQLHGEPLPDVVDALELAGAEVVTVPVYRWAPPLDIGPLDRLIDSTLGGGIDVLAFTSAPAAAGILARAEERGLHEPLLAALRGPVLALCVGPVTAAPLEALDVPTVQPQRSRLGAMVRTCESVAPGRARTLPVAGHVLELRGHAVLVDAELRPLPPTPMALLRLLARRPGRVVSRADLLAAQPGGAGDEHAVENAIARLRAALGVPGLVQTVVRRGYRLALEPGHGGHCADVPGAER